MRQIVIACRVMEPELKRAMEETGAEVPVVWMEAGLHDQPKKLTSALREALSDAEREHSPDQVLLGYGFCGNALAGVSAGNFRLVLPRIDDCITMFIGSRERKQQLEGGVGTMFLTEGWLKRDVGVLGERQALIDEYGEEDGLDIFNMMYGNYRRVGLLDTKCVPVGPVERESRRIAEALGFEHRIFDASYDYLKQLLTGPWTADRFVVKEPFETITEKDLRI